MLPNSAVGQSGSGLKIERTRIGPLPAAEAMVSTLARIVSFVRDSIVASFSLVVISATWGYAGEFFIFDTIAVVFIALAIADVALLIRRYNGRGFFIVNASYQLVVSFIISTGLPTYGLLLMTLNLAVLFIVMQKPRPQMDAEAGPG